MIRHLELDESGEITAILDADTATPGAIAVDVPDSYPEGAKWDAATQSFVEDFTATDAQLLARIDEEAGAFRTRFITSIPGQETTYRLKEDEAIAWLPGLSDPEDFPYLKLEAEAKGMTITALALEVLATADIWRALNPKIEAARTAGKDAVLAAKTLADKQTAAAVNWDALI